MQNVVHAWRLLVKGALLFAILEGAFVWLQPNPGPIDVYGLLNLRRERFPISTRSPVDDALDVGNLDVMFASHVISRPKLPDEFRVVVLGDSAVWGLELTPELSLPGQMDSLNLRCGSGPVRVYNLSFPRSSATKDLMILDKALPYKPDMIVWLITWYTLMPKTRIDHTLIVQNPGEFNKLAQRFDFLPRGFQPPGLADALYDQNRAFFRAARFELYSLIQLGTGLDQIPGPPEVLPAELSSDLTFEGLKPPTLRQSQVSLDQVRDFYLLAGQIPVLLVNEPMQILQGVTNSDLRYNAYYPRWVYDQYRQYLNEAASDNGWKYLDLWDMFPASSFMDTPLHLNPEAEHKLAEALAPSVQGACR